jgi:hypothetical protein
MSRGKFFPALCYLLSGCIGSSEVPADENGRRITLTPSEAGAMNSSDSAVARERQLMRALRGHGDYGNLVTTDFQVICGHPASDTIPSCQDSQWLSTLGVRVGVGPERLALIPDPLSHVEYKVHHHNHSQLIVAAISRLPEKNTVTYWRRVGRDWRARTVVVMPGSIHYRFFSGMYGPLASRTGEDR